MQQVMPALDGGLSRTKTLNFTPPPTFSEELMKSTLLAPPTVNFENGVSEKTMKRVDLRAHVACFLVRRCDVPNDEAVLLPLIDATLSDADTIHATINATIHTTINATKNATKNATIDATIDSSIPLLLDAPMPPPLMPDVASMDTFDVPTPRAPRTRVNRRDIANGEISKSKSKSKPSTKASVNTSKPAIRKRKRGTKMPALDKISEQLTPSSAEILRQLRNI
jgi:hypothetical protein